MPSTASNHHHHTTITADTPPSGHHKGGVGFLPKRPGRVWLWVHCRMCALVCGVNRRVLSCSFVRGHPPIEDVGFGFITPDEGAFGWDGCGDSRESRGTGIAGGRGCLVQLRLQQQGEFVRV
ncbi:hypothetical protein Tco_1240138 [Tanacetum coccineum]